MKLNCKTFYQTVQTLTCSQVKTCESKLKLGVVLYLFEEKVHRGFQL